MGTEWNVDVTPSGSGEHLCAETAAEQHELDCGSCSKDQPIPARK
jgi:hypothetical protein